MPLTLSEFKEQMQLGGAPTSTRQVYSLSQIKAEFDRIAQEKQQQQQLAEQGLGLTLAGEPSTQPPLIDENNPFDPARLSQEPVYRDYDQIGREGTVAGSRQPMIPEGVEFTDILTEPFKAAARGYQGSRDELIKGAAVQWELLAGGGPAYEMQPLLDKTAELADFSVIYGDMLETAPQSEEARQFQGKLQSQYDDLKQSIERMEKALEDKGYKREIKDVWLYRLGETMGALTQAQFAANPKLKNSWLLNKIPETLGGFAPMVAVGMVATAIGGPALGALAVGAMGATQSGGGGYEQAIELGATEAQAREAARWSTLIGAAIALPFSRIIGRVDKMFGGTISKTLVRRGMQSILSGTETGAVMFGMTAAENAAAKSVYDENREYLEGAWEATFRGGIAGTLIHAFLSAVTGFPMPPKMQERMAKKQAERPTDDTRWMPPTAKQRAEREAVSRMRRDAEALQSVQEGTPFPPLDRMTLDRLIEVADAPPTRNAYEKMFPGVDSTAKQRQDYQRAANVLRTSEGKHFAPTENVLSGELANLMKGARGEAERRAIAVEYLDKLSATLEARTTGLELEVAAQKRISDKALPESTPLAQDPMALPAYAEVGIDPQEMVAAVKAGRSAVRSVIRQLLTSAGNLPEEAFVAKLARDARLSQLTSRMRFMVRRFDKAMKDSYGGYGKMTQAELELVNRALRGEVAATDIPAPMRPAVAEMRQYVDALSQAIVDIGAAEGPLAATILENKGVYLTRSYRAVRDPRWMNEVLKKHPEVVTKAKEFLRREEAYQDATDEQLESVIRQMLYNDKAADSPVAFIAESKLGSKDLGILKKRTLEDAPELRDLLGEIKDPRVNFVLSVEKMAHLIANHEFLSRVRTEGLGKWLFTKDTAPPEFHAELAAPESSAMYPLNGLYTTPDIQKAFELAGKVHRPGMALQAFYAANAWVKYGKTVLSIPMTHVRNFTANPAFAVMNGHWDVRKSWDSFRGSYQPIAGNSREWQKAYDRWARLGVVEQGAHSTEIKKIFEDAFGSNTMPDFVDRHSNSMAVRAMKATKAELKGGGLLTKLYRAEDDFWKIYGFENEYARLRKAKPQWTDAQVDLKAAENVRNTYPSYNMLPAGIQWLRKVPLVGPFVAFPAESARTAYKTMRLAAAELRDPQLRHIGAQRIAGMMLVASIPAAIAVAGRYISGIDHKKDMAMREFLPPWSKNSSLWHIGEDGKGNFTYVDMSYTDPHSYLRKPLIAFMNGEEWEQATIDAALEAAEPYISEDILAGKLLDLARNTTESGGRVYNPEDDYANRLRDQLEYLWQGVEPGIQRAARRITYGAQGKVGKHGQSYDFQTEVIAQFTGTRREKVNIPQAFGFKARDFVKSISTANGIVNEMLARRGSVSEDELKSAYQRTESARRQHFEDMHRKYEAALTLGVTQEKLGAIMANRGMSKKQIAMVASGDYVPYLQSEQFMQSLAESADLFSKPGTTTPAEYQRRMTLLRGEALRDYLNSLPAQP